MKQYLFIPVILGATFVLQLFFPWWILTVVCFVSCYLFQTRLFAAFAGSLIAVFLLWVLKAYWADQQFDMPMSALLGNLLGKVSGSAVFLITGLIGGLTAGMSGLLGSWTKLLIQKS